MIIDIWLMYLEGQIYEQQEEENALILADKQGLGLNVLQSTIASRSESEPTKNSAPTPHLK